MDKAEQVLEILKKVTKGEVEMHNRGSDSAIFVFTFRQFNYNHIHTGVDPFILREFSAESIAERVIQNTKQYVADCLFRDSLTNKVDKLQEGDFDYEEQQRPDNETLGHYAEQLREKLGV